MAHATGFDHERQSHDHQHRAPMRGGCGYAAVTLVAPAVAVVEGPAAVLAKAKPSTPVDTQGAPCPGAYCIAPGPDPEVPYGTNPYVPYGPDR